MLSDEDIVRLVRANAPIPAAPSHVNHVTRKHLLPLKLVDSTGVRVSTPPPEDVNPDPQWVDAVQSCVDFLAPGLVEYIVKFSHKEYYMPYTNKVVHQAVRRLWFSEDAVEVKPLDPFIHITENPFREHAGDMCYDFVETRPDLHPLKEKVVQEQENLPYSSMLIGEVLRLFFPDCTNTYGNPHCRGCCMCASRD